MPRQGEYRLVIDTKVLIRGLVNRDSASGRLLRLCSDRAALLLLSRAVMLEYRQVLSREELTLKHPAITPDAVGLLIERLRYFAEVLNPVRVRFRYDRDPKTSASSKLRSLEGPATLSRTIETCLLFLSNTAMPDVDSGSERRQCELSELMSSCASMMRRLPDADQSAAIKVSLRFRTAECFARG